MTLVGGDESEGRLSADLNSRFPSELSRLIREEASRDGTLEDPPRRTRRIAKGTGFGKLCSAVFHE